MKEDSKSVIIGLLLLPAFMVFDGYVLSSVWNWHMVQAFPALGQLSLVHAISLTTVMSVLMLRVSWAEEKEVGYITKLLTIECIRLGLLAIAWVSHAIMY